MRLVDTTNCEHCALVEFDQRSEESNVSEFLQSYLCLRRSLLPQIWFDDQSKEGNGKECRSRIS